MKPVNTFNSIIENVCHPERRALRRVVEGTILALLLIACGDDSSSSGTTPENTSSIDEVADVSLLPPCTASNEYKIIRVLNEETPRICRDNKWFAIAEEGNVQSSDSKDDKISSSTAQPDKSQDEKTVPVFQILLPRQTVPIVKKMKAVAPTTSNGVAAQTTVIL